MNDILNYLREFNIVSMILRLALAFLCGGMIGMERGKRGRAAGLRTHILVCLGAAMTVMTGLFAVQTLKVNSDPLRIGAQVISGIGFLGVGTILITGNTHVKGLTTAAGLWTTAAIGLAIGIGYYEAAIICTAICVLTIVYLSRFEKAGCSVGFVSHYYEIPEIYKDGNNRIVSLSGGIDDEGKRTYKILKVKGSGLAYARDIAKKCGMTYEQIRDEIAGWRS